MVAVLAIYNLWCYKHDAILMRQQGSYLSCIHFGAETHLGYEHFLPFYLQHGLLDSNSMVFMCQSERSVSKPPTLYGLPWTRLEYMSWWIQRKSALSKSNHCHSAHLGSENDHWRNSTTTSTSTPNHCDLGFLVWCALANFSFEHVLLQCWVDLDKVACHFPPC